MSDEHFLPGSQLKIVCNDGYESKSNSTIQICTNNEVWSGENISCEPKRCSTENHPIIKIFSGNASTNYEMNNDKLEDFAKNDSDLSQKLLRTFNFIYEGNSFGDKVALRCKNNLNDLELTWNCDTAGKWKFINILNKSNDEVTSRLLNVNENLCETKHCKLPQVSINIICIPRYIELSRSKFHFSNFRAPITDTLNRKL